MVLKVHHFEELLRLLQLVIGESRIRLYQDSVPQGEYILQAQAVEESHICRCQDLEPQEAHRLEEPAVVELLLQELLVLVQDLKLAAELLVLHLQELLVLQ